MHLYNFHNGKPLSRKLANIYDHFTQIGTQNLPLLDNNVVSKVQNNRSRTFEDCFVQMNI